MIMIRPSTPNERMRCKAINYQMCGLCDAEIIMITVLNKKIIFETEEALLILHGQFILPPNDLFDMEGKFIGSCQLSLAHTIEIYTDDYSLYTIHGVEKISVREI